MLTSDQKRLVQETFAVIAPIADDAAALFYRRLFELDPSLQRMFRGDMAEQRRAAARARRLVRRRRSRGPSRARLL